MLVLWDKSLLTHKFTQHSCLEWLIAFILYILRTLSTVVISLGLNSLQSGLHKQHMKDLFVELCLTVPVRLSSLLPYLPMLMDPLVSALNGSPTLISQVNRLCILLKLDFKDEDLV
jgi:hypothetical protein